MHAQRPLCYKSQEPRLAVPYNQVPNAGVDDRLTAFFFNDMRSTHVTDAINVPILINIFGTPGQKKFNTCTM